MCVPKPGSTGEDALGATRVVTGGSTRADSVRAGLAAVPPEAEVIALLAIGRAEPPDKAYPGRFGLDRVAFAERYGQAWKE